MTKLLPNKVENVQGSDTTGDDSSNKADLQKFPGRKAFLKRNSQIDVRQ